ncbi:hypothetical protein SAMN05444422_112110 [Halobiforma haloterrestris]|uniref:Uncharacterized protein n=1 Tax=Natronobacterium haloterrestre TaxID=148448 RepID=A0A1I1L148_NATHA|nr:hypothetical protein [Halobiforma haloterrestris]SFC63320.1 hypothetical protein SAMN05444422_112110 [Halobiforma haloterrestris]
MLRETTISVSHEEKELLEEAAIELFGTQEVPYGAVVSELVEQVTDTDE